MPNKLFTIPVIMHDLFPFLKQSTNLTPSRKLLAVISLFAASLMLPTHKVSADDHLSLQRPECPVELERRTVEPDVLVVRSDCALPLPALADALGKGLAMLFPDHKPDIRTIYVGRLLDYPDWSAALAKAAAASPAWAGLPH